MAEGSERLSSAAEENLPNSHYPMSSESLGELMAHVITSSSHSRNLENSNVTGKAKGSSHPKAGTSLLSRIPETFPSDIQRHNPPAHHRHHRRKNHFPGENASAPSRFLPPSIPSGSVNERNDHSQHNYDFLETDRGNNGDKLVDKLGWAAENILRLANDSIHDNNTPMINLTSKFPFQFTREDPTEDAHLQEASSRSTNSQENPLARIHSAVSYSAARNINSSTQTGFRGAKTNMTTSGLEEAAYHEATYPRQLHRLWQSSHGLAPEDGEVIHRSPSLYQSAGSFLEPSSYLSDESCRERHPPDFKQNTSTDVRAVQCRERGHQTASMADCHLSLTPEQLQRAIRNCNPSAIGSQVHGPVGSNVFVFHIPNEWHGKDLALQFAQFGPILSARIATDKSTGRRLGFGFVSYTNMTDASEAVAKLNGHNVAGKRLKVTIKRGEQFVFDKQARRPNENFALENFTGPVNVEAGERACLVEMRTPFAAEDLNLDGDARSRAVSDDQDSGRCQTCHRYEGNSVSSIGECSWKFASADMNPSGYMRLDSSTDKKPLPLSSWNASSSDPRAPSLFLLSNMDMKTSQFPTNVYGEHTRREEDQCNDSSLRGDSSHETRRWGSPSYHNSSTTDGIFPNFTGNNHKSHSSSPMSGYGDKTYPYSRATNRQQEALENSFLFSQNESDSLSSEAQSTSAAVAETLFCLTGENFYRTNSRLRIQSPNSRERNASPECKSAAQTGFYDKQGSNIPTQTENNHPISLRNPSGSPSSGKYLITPTPSSRSFERNSERFLSSNDSEEQNENNFLRPHVCAMDKVAAGKIPYCCYMSPEFRKLQELLGELETTDEMATSRSDARDDDDAWLGHLSEVIKSPKGGKFMRLLVRAAGIHCGSYPSRPSK